MTDRLRAALKKRNRTLLELQTGILVLGVILWLLGIILVACGVFGEHMDQGRLALSLWIGILTALAAAAHIYHTLDRSLGADEKTARRKIYSGYLIRTGILLLVLFGVLQMGVGCLLVTSLAYFMLKIAAYLQPLTHRMYNAFFGEKDPESISQEEWDALHPGWNPEKKEEQTL